MAGPLIVALDVPALADAEKLMDRLEGLVDFYKVGLELFTAHGWEAVSLVRRRGAKVFLDLKLHDIPNTVRSAAALIAAQGVELFNVHALGGFDMMREAAESCRSQGKASRVLAVTILTSHSAESLSEVGLGGKPQDEVLRLARLAKKAGLDGVVSSPLEIEALRKEFGPGFLIVTPGIRLAESAKQDQKRTLTPRQALKAGADYLVVGRPITASPDPAASAQEILLSLG